MIDAYTPVYLALHRAKVGPADADGMDLTLVAAMLGVGQETRLEKWRREMQQARRADPEWEWGQPSPN